jgi:hypothetical protein
MGLPLLVYLELITYATVKIVNGDARGLWIEWLTLSILLRITVGNCGSGENTGSSELNLHHLSWFRHISELNYPDN